MTIIKNKAMLLLFAFVAASILMFANPSPASAATPTVRNDSSYTVNVVYYNSFTNVWNTKNVCGGGCVSPPGATRVQTPYGASRKIIQIQSLASGAYYTSSCGGGLQIGNGDGTGNSARVSFVVPC